MKYDILCSETPRQPTRSLTLRNICFTRITFAISAILTNNDFDEYYVKRKAFKNFFINF